jgi:hypothetical protein
MPVTKPYRPQQGHPTTEGCVATPRIILYVNIWAVWSWGVLGVFDPPGTGANFLGLIFSNSVVHTFDSIRHGFAYNPGLLSAWVLFLPFCYSSYRALLDSGRLTRAGVVRSILVGFGGHVILLAALISAGKGFVGEDFVCFAQVASNALTLLVRRPL